MSLAEGVAIARSTDAMPSRIEPDSNHVNAHLDSKSGREHTMSLRKVIASTAALVACASLFGMALADVTQIPVVKLHTQTEVAAAPAAVWAQLTTGKSMVTWCPYWKAEGNTKVNLTKVGDVLDYTDAWGNNGRSIVTYLAKDKELRVAHEPTDGSYLCQAKIVLEPAGKGTKIHYWEMYTDESEPKDRDATAKKTETEMMNTLAALKKSSEKK